MDPMKTRIWNADQLGLPPARKAAGTPGPPARNSAGVHPPAPPRKARGSLPPPPPSRRTPTARWPAGMVSAPGRLAPTRIMPIERLLPRGLPGQSKPPAAPLASRPKTPPPRHRTLKRIVGHVLLATLTVLVIAVWKLPLGPQVRASSPLSVGALTRATAATRDDALATKVAKDKIQAGTVASQRMPTAGKASGAVQASSEENAEMRVAPAADGDTRAETREAAPGDARSASGTYVDAREVSAAIDDQRAASVTNVEAREASAVPSDARAASGANVDAREASAATDGRAAARRPASAGNEDVRSADVRSAGPARLHGNVTSARSRTSGATAKTTLQRRAVELVIAGDYHHAARLYRELASGQPGNNTFREAARILAARRRE